MNNSLRATRQCIVAALITLAVSTPVLAQEWCDTHRVWAERARLLGRPEAVGVCPTEGQCDLPAVRDAYIPDQSTAFKTIRLHFAILREDDGSNPATTEANLVFQLAQLNADFAPHRIRFVGGYHWVNSSAYRSLVGAEVDPMKQAHAFDPAHACNVFVTDLSGIGLAGRGTFPWDPNATTALGGVIMDDDAFGPGQKTLTHEMGHNLGLWHTFHGVSELCHDGMDNCVPCDQPGAIASGACVCPCYERADGFEGDTTGDFASDTPPTPENLFCIPPGGIDVCSATPEPWGPTQPENYMGYAPDSCFSLFTSQQAGRMHCWTTDVLRGWLTDDWGDEFQLTASDGAADDRFGSVSISGDTAIVGAIFDDASATDTGSAYVFVRSGPVGSQTWVQQQRLTASDGAANDWFGSSVCISGDIAIVGAVGDDSPGVDSGSAYVFVRSGAVWTQQQKLTASDGAANDWFGFSVSVSGDTAIVGARLDHAPAIDSGSAYVFVRSGGVWTQQQKLTASDATQDDWFGNSVAISGDTAIVGAAINEAPAVQSGSAYVFVRSGGVWTEQQKLTASDGAAIDWFGWSVAISGDTAIVGAVNDDAPANNSGSAYVFVRSGGVWTQQQNLTASDGAEFDQMGNSVSISGDIAIVGAYNADAPAAASGSAYVFVRSGPVGSQTWTQQQKLTASDGAAGDLFGFSVSVSGDTAIIGANGDDTAAGTNSGSARCYRLLPLSPADINSDGEVNVEDLLAVITSWGPCPPPCPADVNDDGIVNVDDLLIVITNWG